MTPEGLNRKHEVDVSQSITRETGQKLNYRIIAAQARLLDLGEKIWFEPSANGRHVNLPGFKRFLKHSFDLGVFSAKFRNERNEVTGAMAIRKPILSFGMWITRLILIYKRLLRRGSPFGLAIVVFPAVLIGLLAHNAGFSREVFAAEKRRKLTR
jgi:hypothetical protein